MERSIAVAIPSFASLAEAGRFVEDAGFDRAWATELRSRDAIVRALQLADSTTTLTVGTGIAYAFTRHPMAMIASAVEANAAIEGRLTLGVGSGTPHTRSEFGIEFDHPAPRMAEYIDVMKQAVRSSGDLQYHGRFYDVSMPGFAFSRPATEIAAVRIYGSALNAVALRALSKTADGIALHPFGHVSAYLEEVVWPSLRAGSEAARNTLPTVAAWMICCAQSDGARARSLASAQIALYAAQPGFAPYFEHTRWAGAAEAIRDAVHLDAGRQPWLQIGEQLVPREMIDDLAAAGTPDEVADLIARKEEQLDAQGVDELTLQIPGVALPEQEGLAALRAVASAAARPRVAREAQVTS